MGGTPYRDGSYNYYVNVATKGSDNTNMILGSFILAGLEIEPDSIKQPNSVNYNRTSNNNSLLCINSETGNRTIIKYTVQEKTSITSLRIYDLLGKEMMPLAIGSKNIGNYSVEITSSQLKSGFYIVKYINGSYSLSKKFEMR